MTTISNISKLFSFSYEIPGFRKQDFFYYHHFVLRQPNVILCKSFYLFLKLIIDNLFKH